MAKYTPPEQSKIDAVGRHHRSWWRPSSLALWLPLRLGWAGVSQAPSRRSTTRPGKRSARRPAQVEQWVKLGFADAAAAHDIIQNKFDYTIDWMQLIIMIDRGRRLLRLRLQGLRQGIPGSDRRKIRRQELGGYRPCGSHGQYAAWILSAIFGLYMLYDWFRIDTTYSEDVLTSSREGEIEAVTEKHKV